MSEGLGKVAQSLAGGPHLLGVESEVVGVGEHLLESKTGVVEPASPGQAIDEPEGADVEGALEGSFEGIGGGVVDVVAAHEGVVGQLLLYPGERGEPARVCGTYKLHNRHQEQGSVEGLPPIDLDEALLLGVPAFFHDLLVDAVSLSRPGALTGGQAALVRDPDGPLQSDPAHQLGGDEVPFAAANLPDTLVLLTPVAAEPVEDLVEALPQIVVERRTVPVVEVCGVQDGPVKVKLGLLVGGVSEPHRVRPPVAGEV